MSEGWKVLGKVPRKRWWLGRWKQNHKCRSAHRIGAQSFCTLPSIEKYHPGSVPWERDEYELNRKNINVKKKEFIQQWERGITFCFRMTWFALGSCSSQKLLTISEYVAENKSVWWSAAAALKNWRKKWEKKNKRREDDNGPWVHTFWSERNRPAWTFPSNRLPRQTQSIWLSLGQNTLSRIK